MLAGISVGRHLCCVAVPYDGHSCARRREASPTTGRAQRRIGIVVACWVGVYADKEMNKPRETGMKKLILETTAPFQGLAELVAYDEGLFAKEGLQIEWADRDPITPPMDANPISANHKQAR